MNRTIRRLEKAIDELIKIQDDGHGSENIARALELLNGEISKREIEQGGIKYGNDTRSTGS